MPSPSPISPEASQALAQWIQTVAADEAALTQTLDTEGGKLQGTLSSGGLSEETAEQLGASLKSIAATATKLQSDLQEAFRLLSSVRPAQPSDSSVP